MWIFKSLSALLFLIGWTAILLAGVGVWVYLVISITNSLGWVAGTLAFIASAIAFFYWQGVIKAPFLFWMQAWDYADKMILDRNRE